jgi:glycosyltransferase involved in cell wall biosynthesis
MVRRRGPSACPMNAADHPIHAAMVTSAYPLGRREVRGGVEGVCCYLADALAAEDGLRLHLFVAFAERYGFDRYTCLQKNHFMIHAIPSRVPRSRLLSYLFFDSAAALRHASGTRFDLIHFQNDALWAARTSLPSVLTMHGVNERDVLFRGPPLTRSLRAWANGIFHRRMRRRVRNIIAISPYVRRVLPLSARQRVWDIDNPVADSFFEVVREPVVGRVLFAGRISPLKNVAGLIAAFALVTKDNPGCELRLAGAEDDLAYATRCRELAVQLGVTQRVLFLGPVSIKEMEMELARASFLALFSFQENAPLVISEAMAAGVPVVASNVGGVPWLVDDGTTGYLVDPTLPGDIARGLRLGLDAENLGEMSVRAKAVAERRFRACGVAQKTAAVYRQILQRDSTGA